MAPAEMRNITWWWGSGSRLNHSFRGAGEQLGKEKRGAFGSISYGAFGPLDGRSSQAVVGKIGRKLGMSEHRVREASPRQSLGVSRHEFGVDWQ